MLPRFAETLVELSRILPTLTLTNATLFTRLAASPARARSPSSLPRSRSRSTRTSRRAQRRAPRPGQLREGAGGDPAAARARDRRPHRHDGRRTRHRTSSSGSASSTARLGVPDEDHVVRPVVRRGRAWLVGMGVELEEGDVLPELTITADGAFLNPFAPTVRHGRHRPRPARQSAGRSARGGARPLPPRHGRPARRRRCRRETSGERERRPPVGGLERHRRFGSGHSFCSAGSRSGCSCAFGASST